MAPQNDLPPLPENISFYAGPPLVSIMLNYGLFGILIVQVYIYRLCFPNDRRAIKILVYAIFFAEFVQIILASMDAFHWLAYGFGNMNMLTSTYIGSFDVPVMYSIIAFVVQLFFAWRLWVISKSRLLCGVVGMISLVQLGGGLATGTISLMNNSVKPMMLPALSTWLISSAVADVVIATSMTIYLLRGREDFHKHSKDIIVRIVRLTVETNAVSASVAIVTLTLSFVYPGTNLPFAPCGVLGKLYSNSMMVSLNNRISMSAWRRDISIPLIVSQTQTQEPQRDRKVEAYRSTTVVSDMPLERLDKSPSGDMV